MHTSTQLLSRLWRTYIRAHWKSFALALLCMALVAGATAANAWMLKPVLDEVFFGKNEALLMLIPLAVLAISAVNASANYGQTVIMRVIGQKMIAKMQSDLFAHLIRADLALFHDQSAGRLISRFTNDIMLMRTTLTTALTSIVRDTLSMLGLIIVMFLQSWQLALIAFVVFPTAFLPIVKIGRRMRKLSGSTQAQLGHMTARLEESFNGIRMVKAYGREEFETGRAGRIIDALCKLYVKGARVQAISTPLMEMLSGCAIAAVVWYGGSQVISGTTTPGAFFSFIAAALISYKPVRNLSNLNTQLQEGLASAQRFFELIDTKPAIQDSPDAKPLAVTQGAVRFENVSFKYAADGGGIDAVSFDVPAGKTAALVGLSGSGKSTIINLLLRFYEGQSGHIQIDGQDIASVTLASLRVSLGLVSQDVVLFDDSVRANIAYGRLDATNEHIIAAAKSAAAHDFILGLPQGYETVLGPQGVRLSGGQRQRIAIARAMLKNAPILLLDEATSALDTESERAVQSALERLSKGRTTLVIAHRLSTIVAADIIYVMDAGKIVEQGSHADLLSRKGRYWQLYATQEEG